MPWMELLRVTFTLVIIIAMIFGLSYALKRYGGVKPTAPSVLRVLATMSLGNREKVYLLQVGNEQLVVGSSSGGLVTLHTLKESIELQTATPAVAGNVKFAELLRMVGKGWTP